MLGALTVLFFCMHLPAVYLAGAGPLLCVWLEWSGTRHGNQRRVRLARRLARHALLASLFGAGIGIPLLAMDWFHLGATYQSALAAIPRTRFEYAAAELLFYWLCLLAYVLAWDRLNRRRWVHRLLAVVAGTNLIYHFPALFVVVGQLVVQPALRQEGSEFIDLLARPDILSMFLHHVGASFLVAALYLGVLDSGLSSRDSTEMATSQGVSTAMGRLSILVILVQVGLGIWLVSELPWAARNDLLGGDWLSTLAFSGSLLATLSVAHFALAMALGSSTRQTVLRAAWALGLVLLLMTITRHRHRTRVFEERAVARGVATPCGEPWIQER